MAKSFSDVLDEYNQFKVQHPQDDTDLPSFAKQMDEVQGTPDRQEAYTDGHLKRINALIDRGIAATGLPDVTGGALRMAGEGVDSALGTHIAPTVEDVGRSIPRSLAEGALTMAAPELEAPLLLKRLMGAGKVAGYADAALQGYAKTDSPVGAAISVGTLGLQNKLLLPTEGGFQGVGGEAADAVKRYLGRDIPTINPVEGLNPLATNPGFSGLTTAQQVLPGATAIGADLGAVTGVNELSRQASMSVGPNAVPLTDFKDRNPFTAENVAGNIAGALPFALQGIEGYRNRPRTSAAYEGQAENMTSWLKNRDTSNTDYNGYDYEQSGSAQDNFDSSMLKDVDKAPISGRFSPEQVSLLHSQIGQNLDASREQDLEGQPDLANASRANAHSLIQMLSGETVPPEMIRAGADTAGEVSRQMPPETPTGFAKFVQDVNGFIDQLNEGKIKAQSIFDAELPVVPDKITNDRELAAAQVARKAKTVQEQNIASLEAAKGETWSPNATDSGVVSRLQDKGLVPKVTPKYLSDEFHATFNESGDPQFAYHVVVQKVANRLLDNVPAALQAERENPGHVQTQTSPKVAAINEQEHAFYKALTALPESVKDAAIARTVEISKKPEVYVQGRQMNQVSSWRQAVIQAAKSYDPKTDTILQKVGKDFKRVGVHNLVAQDEHGRYLYTPNTSPVRIGEGGKGSIKVRGKTLPEVNIDESFMQRSGGQSLTDNSLDEDEFKQVLAEEGIGGSLQAQDEAGLGTGKAATPDVVAEPTSQEKSLGDELHKKAKVALKNVDSLSDTQLYNVVRPLFQARRPETGSLIADRNEPQRVPLVRTALKAAFENFGSSQGVGPEGKSFLSQLAATGRKLGDFTEKKQLDLALRDFFKVQSPVEGGPKGVSNHLARIGQIVSRLTDPKVVEAAKTVGGASRAMAAPGDEGTSTGKDLLVNHPAEGAFSDDVVKSIRARISDVLGKAGYSGTYRDLMTEVAVALAKQGDNVPVDFYRFAGQEQGMAATREPFSRDGRAQLGLNLDTEPVKGQEVKYVNNLLNTLAHEMSHIDDFVRMGMIKAPDAYSNERLRHLNNLASMAETLQPEERQALLNVLKDGLVPKEYQGNVREESGRVYGSDTPHEFTAEVQSMISRSLLQGKSGGMKIALETLDFAPQEVREFARGTYRTIADILGAVKDSVENPAKGYYPDARGMLPNDALAATLHSVINEARQGSQLRFADQKLQQARAYTASLSQGAANNPPVQLTPSMWFRAADDLGKNFSPEAGPVPTSMARAAESIQEAGQALLPRGKNSINEGVWMGWFAPFSQRMVAMERQGVPLADDIRKLSEDLQTGVTRLRSAILSPFLKKDPDGTVKLDQDNPLIKLVQHNDKGEWRKVLNEVSDWQQRNGAQNMFVADDKGVVTVNKQLQGADERWNIIKSRLSVENQQLVMSGRVAMDQVGQEAAQRMVAALDITNRKRVARLLMAMNPQMLYEQAKAQADITVATYLKSGDVSSLERTTPPNQMAALNSLLAGTDGVISKFKEVADLLMNRPGFSTEALPGDYIIQFKNPAGDTKYLSGDTQHKANLIAAKLKQEGNTIVGDILHKKDLRSFSDFDAPDVLLGKFTDVEQAAWQRATAAVEASVGSEAADAMRTYVPGTASMKDVANKGLNRYLQERQSKVDTSRYDYIDGMLTWAGKLAAGLAYKSTTMEKDLVLADPRAKAYPEFAGLVNTHFDNLMSPTSELARQVKTFAMSYMMGGSLASGIINGTQSTVSLIPTLIQMSKKGIGPVGAYSLLGQAVGDMAGVHSSDKWQGVARTAEAADPKEWSLEQSLAAMYKRNKEEGGIDHGVIQGDLFSGSDQKTILNAKFGHGDNEGVTKMDLVKNGAYLLAQVGLMPFGWVEKRNNEVALFSAVRQGYADGLRGEDLYDYAKKIKVLSTYGGGKANSIGAVSKLSGPYTRSAVAIATTLQSYGFAMTTSYAQYLRDALGRSEGLSPIQRRQAIKALGTMLMTQVALGGALGLPFAAASLTALEKLFGIQANAAVRQGLASLGQDEDQGATIAETALNGLGNQMLGLDLSSRVGVSNILGTSSYRGFNLADMAGPVGNIATNMATALNLFATNQPGKAITELVPNAFKQIVQNSNMQAKYGDSGVRDQSGNLLYQPTPSQSAMTMLGFRPRAVSEKQQAQSLLTLADQQATAQRGRVLDSAAQSLLGGDAGPARKFAMDTKYNDFTTNPRDIYQSIVNRGVDMSTEKDLLASGPSYNEADRSGIASTFGPDVVDRQSEMDRTGMRAQLAARVGAPSLLPQSEDYKKAAIVDSLVKTRGMPRSQALRLVEFLHL